MKRRQALWGIALVGSTVAAFGGFKWFSWHREPDFAYFNQQKPLLAALAETILPATDTPGAIDAGVPDFIMKMILENTSVVSQNRFINGLKDIDAYSVEVHQKPYAQCSKAQQNEVMRHFEEQGKPLSGLPGKVERKVLGNSFFTILKELTCIGYCTSEVGMTQGLAYELVPGRFAACIPLAPGQKSWATK
ncbi:gluconate 2-dehydrogenase subunit 3 family protein [Larkinella rosea]|uniref:Gluconate 2-dehydrogenase subunit 3 family protein n=1 Tax=Larkinella rosea TaxID=2025312 RepID=A0A3P1BJN1_9BACT|nr:gluconate 2-dehydrogenase subunit 3 family protein [Larkinella rosea]RRB01235.1 gluconate 2-dehydrogenase subunit 3 family protein [Larkinella rosea]